MKDEFTTMSGRRVELGIYVEPGKAERAAYAMDALKRSMRWDEQAFGREYDLDVFNIVAVSDFNMGAMENKGLNVFNDKYVLASPETATDGDYAGIETVIAHEYFHNWTGNRITCRDWFQLCLKEGLTVFRDQEFSSDERSRPVKRISDVRTLRAHQFAEDAGPLAHPVRPEVYREINNFYTATIYEKGAEVIRMLKRLIGAETFRKGMDLYFDRHDGEATTIEAFIACFAEASGRDLASFMRWYGQAGTPELKVSTRHDPEAATLTLDIEQIVPPTPGQPVKKPMPMPFALGLIGANGQELPLVLQNGTSVNSGMLEITEGRHSFTFTGVTARPVPSLNRGFSAPVRVTSDLSDDDLVFLARYDRDPFNRWESAQKAALRVLVASVSALRAGKEPLVDDRFADAFQAVIEDETLEHAFMAQMLALPSETEVALEIGQDVDPDAIHQATDALRRSVSGRLADTAGALYARLGDSGPFAPDAASAGRRALRATLLGLLTAKRDDAAAELAEAHYRSATNMTGGPRRHVAHSGRHARGGHRRLPHALRERPAGARQMAWVAGGHTGSRYAGTCAAPDAGARLQPGQSQPRACSHR
jgi:aminopeptidase N